MEALYQSPHDSLVADCKKGDRKAQCQLYKLYSRAMYNVCLRIVNNEDEAADVLQESFIDAFSRIGDFRQESTFGLWIKQIVVNKSISLLRKRRIEFVAIEDADVDSFATEQETDEDEIEYQVERVKKGIELLPDNYRVVLTLYLLEGYDHEEISHILKITENTSRSQLLRARRKLIEIVKNIK